MLQRLCIKIKFNEDDLAQQQIYYDNGCFADNQPTLFKNAEVGRYYDFGTEVSMEVRSSEDPYMVFAYTRDNLGTDFTLFLFLAILFSLVSVISLLIVCYYYCCVLEKRSAADMNIERTSVPGSFDSDLEFRNFRNR